MCAFASCEKRYCVRHFTGLKSLSCVLTSWSGFSRVRTLNDETTNGWRFPTEAAREMLDRDGGRKCAPPSQRDTRDRCGNERVATGWPSLIRCETERCNELGRFVFSACESAGA